MGTHLPTAHPLGADKTIQLDWRLRHDERSLAYKVATKINVNKRLRNRHWTKNLVLDQGAYYCPYCKQYGACCGYSGLYTLFTTPRKMTVDWDGTVPYRQLMDQLAHKAYHGAQDYDQWQGNFNQYEGSSVLGTMQYFKKVGAIRAYLWATTLVEIQAGISNYGAFQVGTDWDYNMFEPSRDGTIVTGGGTAGGHAYELIGVDFERKAFEIPNTWGIEYGIGGSVWLPFTEMQKLIERRGEFALPRKHLLNRTLVLP